MPTSGVLYMAISNVSKSWSAQCRSTRSYYGVTYIISERDICLALLETGAIPSAIVKDRVCLVSKQTGFTRHGEYCSVLLKYNIIASWTDDWGSCLGCLNGRYTLVSTVLHRSTYLLAAMLLIQTITSPRHLYTSVYALWCTCYWMIKYWSHGKLN